MGVLVAAAVVPLALAGGRWPLLAAPVVVVSGVVDNLDGAVAVLTGRTSRWGALADALADRVSDAVYVVALWLSARRGGSPCSPAAWRCCTSTPGPGPVGSGCRDAAVITVAERPTRIVGATMFLLAAGIYPGSAATWATAGAAFGVAVGVVGLLQLLPTLRRRLLDDHVK